MEHGASERVKEQSHTVMPVKTEVDKAAQSTAYCEIQANANYTEEEPGLPELVKSEPALLVKEEVVVDGWQDIAELQCMQGPSTSAVVGSTDVFDSIGDLDNILNVKEELGAIDIGPTVLQHTDAWYTTNQKDVSVVKQERAINHDKTDPILCVGVKDEIIEDERRGSLTPQDTLMEQPGTCTALHSLHKECLETVCRVQWRRLDVSQCDVCDAVYIDTHKLRQHVQDVHGPRPQGSLRQHVKSPQISKEGQKCATDSEPRIYTCDYCKKMFTRKGNMGRHIAEVHSSRSYKCHQCDKIFRCKKYLMKHTANVHNAKVHTAADTDDQRVYEAVQSKQREQTQSYSCDKCGKTYTRKTSLREHNKNVHSTECYKCSKCNKKFPSKAYLNRHTLQVHSEQQYECAVCKKICKSKPALNVHVYQAHRPRPAGLKPRIYACDYCKKMFTEKRTMRRHIAHMHLSGSYECQQCDKIYKCKDYLMLHKTRVHPAGLQIHKCEYCQKTFRYKSTLRLHTESIHVAAHIHRCRRCNRNFKSSDMLQRHNTSIHAQYKCQVCLKCYKTIYTLRRHFEKAHNSKDIQFQSDVHPHAMPDLHLTADVTNAAASTSKQQHNVDVVKEEPADAELELGPVVFQHMDCNYRPYEEEPQDGSGGSM